MPQRTGRKIRKNKTNTQLWQIRATWTSLTSGRALHCCKKNAFNSMCLVLRVDPLRLIIPSAAEESQHGICCVSSALHPNFNNQFHCCRKLRPSHAPESAATNSASPLLRAIVDCSLLDAVIGASPAQSESPYVNTQPTGGLFTTSRLSVVGRTVMIPGFPRRYRRIDVMFLVSVSPARPRLDEASPIAQRKSARSNPQQFSNELSVDSLFACRHIFPQLAPSPSAVLVSS